MAQVKFHKYVAALPAQLEPNAIYYVRAGDGFDTYVTNGAGTIVAYPANTKWDALKTPAIASGALTIDLGSPAGFRVTLNQNVTSLNFTNVPSGRVVVFTITWVQDATGGRKVTFPASVKADGGGAPAQPATGANAVTVQSFYTDDGGATVWQALVVPDDVYRRDNIIGTVSSTPSGVPTGAIIESGSNANGSYTKYADGTLRFSILHGSFQCGPSSVYNSPTLVFPVSLNTLRGFHINLSCLFPYDLTPNFEPGISPTSFKFSVKNTGSGQPGPIYAYISGDARWR